MKSLLSVFAIFLILFFSQTTISSCSKTNTVTKTDTVTTYIPYNNTLAGMLMGKEWIVDSLYGGYTAGTPGTRVYARGASNNSVNLDNAVVLFLLDGTQIYANSAGTFTSFTYSFRSSDSLNLLINNPNADYARIVKLDANYLTIYDSTNSGLSYYKVKP